MARQPVRTVVAAATAGLLIPLGLVLSAGCASNKIVLSLDLYREEVTVPPTQAQLSGYLRDLETVSDDALALAEDRKELAREMANVYFALLETVATARRGAATRPSPRILAAGEEFLRDYEDKVDAKAEEVRQLAAEAAGAVRAYSRQRERDATSSADKRDPRPATQPAEPLSLAQMNQKLQAVATAAEELSGDLGTDFEAWLIDNWNEITRSARTDVLAKLSDEKTAKEAAPALRAVQGAAAGLRAKLQKLEARGRLVATRATAQLDAARRPREARDARAMVTNARTVFAAALSGAKAVQTPGLKPDSARATQRLESVADLERLQDPADPVWRTLADPVNEEKWTKQFTRTFFYAEGNSSTVIVRDAVNSFRVQNGRNNPAALIKGQLEISRAVANAAIEVAGAASGIPVGSLTKIPTRKPKTGPETPSDTAPGETPADEDASDDDSGTDDTASTGTSAEDLARRQATVERQRDVRRQALRNLERSLGSLRGEFAALPDKEEDADKKRRQALLGRLQSTLKAHQAIFAAPPAEDEEAPGDQTPATNEAPPMQ